MDYVAATAARLLAVGDPLGALKHIALRQDPPGLAMRGIAMAQLGDYERARKLLRRAAHGFGYRDAAAKARCQVAEAEIAFAARDLNRPGHSLTAALKTLDSVGDRINARHARLIDVRRRLLMGDLAAARQTLALIDAAEGRVPPALVARIELTRAELAIRALLAEQARKALDRAQRAATAAGIPALLVEIEKVRNALLTPAARLIRRGEIQWVRLDQVEVLFASEDLIVDACHRAVRGRAGVVLLATRPILFGLLCALADAWPGDVSREMLIRRAFQARAINESHRARLRVALGRLRGDLQTLARIEATPRGYALVPVCAPAVVTLSPPIEGPAGSIQALLAKGESWSTSALACALGISQRGVQRALRELQNTGAVHTVGHGRSRRWLAPPLAGFATTLLLPAVLSMSYP